MKSIVCVAVVVVFCLPAVGPGAAFAQVGPLNPAAFAAALPRPEAVVTLPSDPDIPVEMLDLMRASQLKYQEGSTLIRTGDRAKARAAFDASLDLILKSPYTLHDVPVLDRFFQDLVRQIQDEESRHQNPAELEEKPESAVVDELDQVDLIPITVDPSLRDVVEQDLANTRYDIPVTLNERVLKSLDYWLNRGRRFFTDGLIRSGRYQPMIQQVFREAAIPLDVMYLAQVESLFKTNALSRAQCKGIWQFGKWTAIRYGLKVNAYIDERSDPEKSTRAAARYLNDLYAMFKDWNLVLAAYNWGEAKVQRLMERSGLSDFWDLAELGHKRRLPAETKNHVPLIMASIILARNPQKYGLPTELDRPLEFERTTLPHAIDLRAAAKILEVPFDRLKELNPAVRTHVTPVGYSDFELKLPAGTSPEITTRLASLPEARLPVRSARLRHKVKPGETLRQIAARYKVSPSALQSANRLGNRPLRAGTWIEIPGKSRPVRAKTALAAAKRARKPASGVRQAAAKRRGTLTAATRQRSPTRSQGVKSGTRTATAGARAAAKHPASARTRHVAKKPATQSASR